MAWNPFGWLTTAQRPMTAEEVHEHNLANLARLRARLEQVLGTPMDYGWDQRPPSRPYDINEDPNAWRVAEPLVRPTQPILLPPVTAEEALRYALAGSRPRSRPETVNASGATKDLLTCLLEFADDAERAMWQKLRRSPNDLPTRNALADYLLERNRPKAARLVRRGKLP